MIGLIAVLALSSFTFAQNKVGTTAAPFLGIAVGPRSQAMGGAYVADAGDVSAVYWNPGALPRIKNSGLMLSHTQWILGTSLNWLGMNINLKKGLAIGLGITQLDYGREEITTVQQQEGTGRYWDAQDVAAGFSIAQALTDRFSIGGTFKYINQRIWNESASAFAVDVGLLFITNFNGLRLGMNIANYGSEMRLDGDDLLQRIDIDPEHNGNNETLVAKMKTENFPLPLSFRIGVAYDLVNQQQNRLTMAVDALHPTDNVESMNLGTEYTWNNMFSLRAGYNSLFKKDAQESWALGAGIRYELWSGTTLRIDYAFIHLKDFDDPQTFAFSYIF